MKTIIRAADGREFSPEESVKAEQYERLRQRLAELTGPDQGARPGSAAGRYPRPISLLMMDPFAMDEIELAERIGWAQEVVNAWAAVLEWNGEGTNAEGGTRNAERETPEEVEVPLPAGRLPLESWKWSDERIDGAGAEIETEADLRESVRSADREARKSERRMMAVGEPFEPADGVTVMVDSWEVVGLGDRSPLDAA